MGGGESNNLLPSPFLRKLPEILVAILVVTGGPKPFAVLALMVKE